MSQPLLLGHRGARATRSIPENTIESFDLALAHGCDGFEFDVRQTADGRAVICHDHTVICHDHTVICHDHTVHAIEVARAVSGDLQNFPVLQEVLARYSPTAFLDVEVKVPGLEVTVVDALRAHPPQRGYVVSSFLPEVLLCFRRLDREVPLGLICEDRSQLAAWTELPIQFVIPHHSLVDEALCQFLHAAREQILVWTVNSREEMLQLRSWGVDGIISDDTKLLLDVLRPPKA